MKVSLVDGDLSLEESERILFVALEWHKIACSICGAKDKYRYVDELLRKGKDIPTELRRYLQGRIASTKLDFDYLEYLSADVSFSPLRVGQAVMSDSLKGKKDRKNNCTVLTAFLKMAYRKVNDCQKNQEKDLRRLDELKLFCEETGRLPHQSGTSSEKALRQWADNAPRRKNPCNQCVLNELEKLKEKYAKSARSSVEMFEAYMDFCRQNSKKPSQESVNPSEKSLAMYFAGNRHFDLLTVAQQNELHIAMLKYAGEKGGHILPLNLLCDLYVSLTEKKGSALKRDSRGLEGAIVRQLQEAKRNKRLNDSQLERTNKIDAQYPRQGVRRSISEIYLYVCLSHLAEICRLFVVESSVKIGGRESDIYFISRQNNKSVSIQYDGGVHGERQLKSDIEADWAQLEEGATRILRIREKACAAYESSDKVHVIVIDRPFVQLSEEEKSSLLKRILEECFVRCDCDVASLPFEELLDRAYCDYELLSHSTPRNICRYLFYCLTHDADTHNRTELKRIKGAINKNRESHSEKEKEALAVIEGLFDFSGHHSTFRERLDKDSPIYSLLD